MPDKETKIDEIKNSMVAAYLEPILGRLSERAREEVIENFCRPRCGEAPGKRFCFIGRIVYKSLLRELLNKESSLN